jgi:hypothetical protein
MVTAVSQMNLFEPLFSFSVRDMKFTIMGILCDKIIYTCSDAVFFFQSHLHLMYTVCINSCLKLTTRNRAFVEKLLVAQVVEQFTVLYEIGRFITGFTTFFCLPYTAPGECRNAGMHSLQIVCLCFLCH